VTLVIIFGPPAVGKMAVAFELERLTGFRAFHNHLTVDPLLPLFRFASPEFGENCPALQLYRSEAERLINASVIPDEPTWTNRQTLTTFKD
jgi:hypothetical protein